jgi:hypothetical protein
MRHQEFQSQPIRECLQVFLEAMVVGGMTAAAIAEQQESARVGIVLMAMPFPPSGDAVAAEFTGIVAGANLDIAYIVRYVIQPVGNDNSSRQRWPIMVKHLYRFLGVEFSLSI